MNKQCQMCQAQMDYKEGTGKESGKPYKMWKCQNTNCKHIEWVRSQPQAKTHQTQQQIVQNPDNFLNFANSIKEEIKNAKNEVIAEMRKQFGNKPEEWQGTDDGEAVPIESKVKTDEIPF